MAERFKPDWPALGQTRQELEKAADQLDTEVDAGDWVVVTARVEDVFSAVAEDLWRMVLKRQSGRLALLAA